MTAQKALSQSLKLGSEAKPVAQLIATNSPALPAQPAASVTKLGNGRIAGIYFNLGMGISTHAVMWRGGF